MTNRPRSPLTSALSTVLPKLAIQRKSTVNVGFLAPLSGHLRAWGEPGLHGCEIWRDRINAQDGLRVGDRSYLVNIAAHDTCYQVEEAFAGARKLVLEKDVRILLMVGGNDFSREVGDFVNEHRVLTTTLLPTDLTPDTRTLFAPSEVHPIYNVTGVDWLKRNDPSLKTAVLCTQHDEHGLPSIATYRAAFEAAEIDLLAERLFPITTTDFSEIVADLLRLKPDILCWDTAYEPFVHAMTIEAFKLGFEGRILSCTCDAYPLLVERTSAAFMERFVFQFPDFDDPALLRPQINFADPHEFYREFCERFPDTWSAVSWEYVSALEFWKDAVHRARTFHPDAVLAAMKIGGKGKHVFGDATWWGRELFGIDNALVGSWPVVTIQQGKARIVEFCSILDWLERYGDLLVKHMRSMDLMWDQRERLFSAGL
jgi:branched-chain amino acid transport system substrate-binding protein